MESAQNVVALNPRKISTFALAPDGTKTPFAFTGIRAIVAAASWIEIDFNFATRRVPISVMVGSHVLDRNWEKMPQLVIHPYCGNDFAIRAGEGTQWPDKKFELIGVNSAELVGDIRDWLKKTSSGDPLGELALKNPGAQTRLDAREFVIAYCDVATVTIKITQPENALLDVHLRAMSVKAPSPDAPFQALDSVIRIGASNAVHVHFNEVTRQIVR